MDFTLNEQQTALANAARQFAEKSLAPFASQWDDTHHFPVDTVREAGRQGYCGLYANTQYGGLGLPRLDAALVFEQMATGCTTTTAYITIHNMVTWMLGDCLFPEQASLWALN